MKLGSNVLKTLGAGLVLASFSVAAHAGGDTIFTGGSIVQPGAGSGTPTSGTSAHPNFAPAPGDVPEPGMIVSAASMIGMTGLGLVRGRRRSAKSAK